MQGRLARFEAFIRATRLLGLRAYPFQFG